MHSLAIVSCSKTTDTSEIKTSREKAPTQFTNSDTLVNKKVSVELKLNKPNERLRLKWTGKTKRQENSSQRIEIVIFPFKVIRIQLWKY